MKSRAANEFSLLLPQFGQLKPQHLGKLAQMPACWPQFFPEIDNFAICR